MAMKASLVLAGISIALLVVYGADVGVAQGDGEGFLPFDHKTRGIGLGGPSLVLPIIAYFISRKEPSKGLGVMLIVSAILIIIGGVTVLVISNPAELAETGRNAITEAAPLIGIGGFIIALGVIKLKKS